MHLASEIKRGITVSAIKSKVKLMRLLNLLGRGVTVVGSLRFTHFLSPALSFFKASKTTVKFRPMIEDEQRAEEQPSVHFRLSTLPNQHSLMSSVPFCSILNKKH